jgi:hypothetical protein
MKFNLNFLNWKITYLFFFLITSRKSFNDSERCIAIEYLPIKDRPAEANKPPGKMQLTKKNI